MWDLSRYKNNTAVLDDRGNTLTYGELQEQGEELISAIAHENGPTTGGSARCLVFQMCGNVLGSLVGYISFLNGGVVPAMLKGDLDEELKRLPMIILDTKAILKDRNAFSARGAGILGFSMFGRDRIYALDEDMNLDLEGLNGFLEKHEGEDIFLFGFTFMIWQHFYRRMLELASEDRPDLSRGVLIHGGGWKKLAAEAVSPAAFKGALHEVCGIEQTRIYDYYGMVEQTGTIYMECECGHLHTPRWSDIIIRNPEDWSVQPAGEAGIVEVVSALPGSYPGHVLLTEDEGVIEGEDDCPCGRKGKYFRILGRIKNAEIRGCSDTYADKFSRK